MSDFRTIAAKLQHRRRLAGWKEPKLPLRRRLTLSDIRRCIRSNAATWLLMMHLALLGLLFLLIAIEGLILR